MKVLKKIGKNYKTTNSKTALDFIAEFEGKYGYIFVLNHPPLIFENPFLEIAIMIIFAANTGRSFSR